LDKKVGVDFGVVLPVALSNNKELKSKNEIAQKNELLCKLIAHNIIVLISEMTNHNLTSLL
jgi:hypothetical protein